MKVIGMILPGIYFKQTSRGFTLVEAILYVALLSFVLLSVVTLMYWIMDNRTKTQVMADVEMQGILASDEISQRIRNSTGINAPAAGTSASSLSLVVTDVAKNPTIIDLSSGKLRIKEGASAAVDITTSHLAVTSLTFQNVTRATTPGSIKASFTLTYVNPGNTKPFTYNKNFYFAADPRGY